MKASQIAAKIATRLFLIFLCVALVPFLQGDNSRLNQMYLTIPNKWTLVFPILLMLGFIALFLMVSIKKYKATDLNWLLVLNTAVLLVYGIAFFLRIYHAMH